MDNNKWSRRKFTKAVISAKVLLASGALSLPLACVESKSGHGLATLNESQQKTLKSAMDEIIPANDKMPSASQVGGVNYILKMIGELPEITPLFVKLTDEIESQVSTRSKTDFSNLSSKERIAVLTSIEKNHPELFQVLKDFTYEAYYTSKEIYKLIQYEPHPTGSSGPEMQAFDEQLLNSVKNMPSRYIQI